MKKKVTMYTLASELNMSVSAISRAFNPNSKLSVEKRTLILAAAEKAGYVPNQSASRLSQSTLNIGVLLYEYMPSYAKYLVSGIESAYNELKGFKVNADIRRLTYGEASSDDAYAILDEFVANRYDGILLTPPPSGLLSETNPFMERKVREITSAGIKVGLIDEDAPNSGRLFVSMNNLEVTGKIAAELLTSFVAKKPCNVALFYTGKIKSRDLFLRSAEEAGINVVAHEYINISMEEKYQRMNKEKLDSVFTKNPEINGVYVNTANCLPVCRYLEKHDPEHRITLITSDIFDEMQSYIRKGIIKASIYQDPFSQGYNAFKTLYYVLAEKRKVPEEILAHPQIILKSNIDLF